MGRIININMVDRGELVRDVGCACGSAGSCRCGSLYYYATPISDADHDRRQAIRDVFVDSMTKASRGR